jgi:hypothetical protein
MIKHNKDRFESIDDLALGIGLNRLGAHLRERRVSATASS